MASRTVEVRLVGDERDLVRAFGRASDKADTFGSSLTGKLGKGFGVLAKGAGVAAVALGGGLAAGVGVGVKSLLEHEKVNALLESRLKSTGNAANTTVDGISALADSIEKKSGIDDVAIKSGAALLLTFKNVKNEAGEGNAVFDRSVELIADLAASGKDADAAAKALGKALNDPISASRSLRSVGISLTDAQKKQIEAMVEAGDVAGAQKLILGELEDRYGTAAEAAGTTLPGRLNILNILKARLEEVAEKVAARLLPVFESLVAWVEQNWPQISAVFEAVFNAIGTVWSSVLQPALSAMRQGFQFVVDWVRNNWGAIREKVSTVLAAVREIIDGFVEVVQAVWERFGETIKRIASNAWDFIKRSVQNAIDAIKGIIDVFIGVLTGDWDRAWNGIKKTVGATLDQAKNIISTAFDSFKTLMKDLGGAILDGLIVGVKAIGNAVKDHLLTPAKNAIVGFGETIFDAAKSLGGRILDGIGDGLSALGSKLAGWVKAPINAVIGAWNSLGIPGFSVHQTLPGPIPDINFSFPGISLPDIPMLAGGTPSFQGGMAIVGEQGPELVSLPRGSRVFPNGIGPGGITLNVYPTGAAADDPMALSARLSWALRGVV